MDLIEAKSKKQKAKNIRKKAKKQENRKQKGKVFVSCGGNGKKKRRKSDGIFRVCVFGLEEPLLLLLMVLFCFAQFGRFSCLLPLSSALLE